MLAYPLGINNIIPDNLFSWALKGYSKLDGKAKSHFKSFVYCNPSSTLGTKLMVGLIQVWPNLLLFSRVTYITWYTQI